MTSSAAAVTTATLPIGTIVASARRPNSLPPGWLPCDGSAIPAQYQELMTLLNTTHTPNLTGRTLIGAGNLSAASTRQTDDRNPKLSALGSVLQIGDTGGEALHQLAKDELPSHSHTINGGNFGLHQPCKYDIGALYQPFENNPKGTSITSTDDTGGGHGHYNVQPYYAVTYIIFAGA